MPNGNDELKYQQWLRYFERKVPLASRQEYPSIKPPTIEPSLFTTETVRQGQFELLYPYKIVQGGIEFTTPPTKIEEAHTFLWKDDNTVWSKTGQEGSFNPQTGEFQPIELPTPSPFREALGRMSEDYSKYVEKAFGAAVMRRIKGEKPLIFDEREIMGDLVPEEFFYMEDFQKQDWLEKHPDIKEEYIKRTEAVVNPAIEKGIEEYKEWETPRIGIPFIGEVEPAKIALETVPTLPFYLTMPNIPGMGRVGAWLKRLIGKKSPRIAPGLLYATEKAGQGQFPGKTFRVLTQTNIAGKKLTSKQANETIALAYKLTHGKSPEEIKVALKLLSGELKGAARYPTFETLIGTQYDPSIMGALNEFFGTKILNPMASAKTPASRALIAWGGMADDMAPALATIDMAAIRANRSPFIIDSVTGLVKNVKPIKTRYGLRINEIFEFPNRYILNQAQQREINLIEKILGKQFTGELEAGVKVFPARLKPGQRYFPRFYSEITDLEGKAINLIKGGTRRPGVRPGSFRDRYYDEVSQAIAGGKTPMADYRSAVQIRLIAGNKAIADKMFANFLAPLGKTPLERLPAGLVEKAIKASSQIKSVNYWLKGANRAGRGEKLPTQTLNAMRGRFPTLTKKLEQALAISNGKDRKLALNKLLKTANVELKAIQTKARAIVLEKQRLMRIAKVPRVGKEGLIIEHAGLQGKIFPIDVSDPVNAGIRARTSTHQILEKIAKVNDAARMGQTAIDTGYTLIQGLMLLYNNPRAWGKATYASMRTLVNPNYVSRVFTTKAQTMGFMTRHGAAPWGSSEFTRAARAGGWLEKIPGIGKLFKRFGYAFETWIDMARLSHFEAQYPLYLKKYGGKLSARQITELATGIDHMVGISSLNRLGVSKFTESILRNSLYAPRYYAAFINMLTGAFKGGVYGNLTRKSIAKYLVGITATMTALNYALGQEDRVKSGKLYIPTSGEFMTVTIGGVHMGLGGVWIAAFRLGGSIYTAARDDPDAFISLDPHENPLLRYGYGRASPIASGVIDIATGKNYLGERLDTPDDYLGEVIDKTFPFWAQDQAKGWLTDENVPQAGFSKGLAEWWGLRAWMVQYRELAREYAEANIKFIPDEMMMDYQKQIINSGQPLRYEDLNNEQRAWLLETFEDYRLLEEKRKARALETGTDFKVIDAEVKGMLDASYHFGLAQLAQGVFAGQATILDYMDQSEYYRRIRSGEYQYQAIYQQISDPERWAEQQQWLAENISYEDKLYDWYMELRSNPPKVGGVPDWDAWKIRLDSALAQITPEQRAYIERRRDDWIKSLPQHVQRIEQLAMECETVLDGYYANPEGDTRLRYREIYPEVDAKLYILGRVGKLRTVAAANLASNMAGNYGIPLSIEMIEKPIRPSVPQLPEQPTYESWLEYFKQSVP